MDSHIPYRFPFVRYPALRLVLVLAGGILLAACTSLSVWVWAMIFMAALICFLASSFSYRRSLRSGLHYVLLGSYLITIFAFGGLWQIIFDHHTRLPSSELLSAYTWEEVNIWGTIYNINETSTGKYQLDIAVDTTIIQDTLQWNEPYNLRAIYDPADAPVPESIQLGSIIHFKATIYPLEAKSNPHEFDYKSYLASQGIYTQAGIKHMYWIKPAEHWLSWNYFRQWALSRINHNFSKETIPLAKALLLGYKNELDRADKIAFSRVGLSHIMAVSGLHVGFILAPFWLIIPFFWTFRHGKQVGLGMLILALLIYAGLTGFSASVMRASITGGLITYGRLFHKARDSINLTAVAALVILLINPNELFQIGFQLSFAAVFIILLILPVLQQFLPNRIRFRWYGKPVMIVLVSIVVQLGLYPMLSYYFGEFSLSGPLANALVVPGLMFVVPYALFLLPVSIIFPYFGYVLNAPCRWFLDLLQWFVLYAADWNWSWIQTPSTGVFVFLIWLISALLIASLLIPRLRWKLLILLLLLVCLQQGQKLYLTLQLPIMQVTMLDVGQGDATLITTPAGRHVLIDTGRWTPDYNSARYVIIPHLKAMGISTLDAVFLSHPHADHIGGISELIRKIPIDTIYNAGFPYDSDLYKNYLRQAADKGIPVKSLQAGMRIPVDPLMRTYIYGPAPSNHYNDPNDQSLIIEFIYGDTEFLFGGDAGKPQEKLVLKNFGPMVDTDFLKVGHHGSRTSSSRIFLRRATPNFSAVSLGKTNRFDHPHPEAVENLRRSGSSITFTSLDGALQFISDGSTIVRQKWQP